MSRIDTAIRLQTFRRPASLTSPALAGKMSASCSCCSRQSLASRPDQRDQPGIIENKGQLRNMHARSLVALWLSEERFRVSRSRPAEVRSVSWHRRCTRHRMRPSEMFEMAANSQQRCAGETKDLEQSGSGRKSGAWPWWWGERSGARQNQTLKDTRGIADG